MEGLEEVLEKASKCLNCKNALCRKGCPIATNIPEFIAKIKDNDFKAAFNILYDNNLMSEICSTVCPVESQCMGSCVRGIKGEPVQINYLEKFINKWARENNIEYKTKTKKKTDKKVAIIGAGPAGISCGIELKKEGYSVTIFEKEAKCGGILEYGIPDFRLERETISSLIKRLEDLGIEIKNNCEFGKNITIDELKQQGYDAIFIGIGAQRQSKYPLTRESTRSIYQSDEFLKMYSNKNKIDDLGITVVIGGGNVAFDSARAALRMGAKEAYILYRRNRELMPAREVELEDAINDGVKMVWQTKVIGANVVNEKITLIECKKTKIENEKAVDIDGSNYLMSADTVIFAIGASADEQFFDKIGIKTNNGLVQVDEKLMTNIDGVYAGGDLVETKSSICRAIATGKKAARAIIDRKESEN